MTVYSAKNATVRFGGATYAVKRWDVPPLYDAAGEMDEATLLDIYPQAIMPFYRPKPVHNRRWRRRQAYRLASQIGTANREVVK